MQSETTRATDRVRRFIFENRPVRGHWVALEKAWRELRAHTHYPPAVERLLGEAVAASVLLAATLKFRGTLTFQLEGNGAVSFLVAQCTHDFRLRAVARWEDEALAGLGSHRGAAFRELVGSEGRVMVTVESDERSMRYQGIVPLTGDSLAASLETYFASSEQLPTRVSLAADETHAAGILVQKLPEAEEVLTDEQPGRRAWEEAERGIATVGSSELLAAKVEEVLGAHFPRHDLRLFRGTRVLFECRCSAGRVASVLRALGGGEIRDVLREQGAVTVTCEFCQRPYRFDSIDIEALFTDDPGEGGAGTIH